MKDNINKCLTVKLINIQGLTNVKLMEVEKLIEKNSDIVCITETQLKIDKIKLNDNIIKYERKK